LEALFLRTLPAMMGTPNLRPQEAATIDPVRVLDPNAVETILLHQL
jgi:hypothetical protein